MCPKSRREHAIYYNCYFTEEKHLFLLLNSYQRLVPCTNGHDHRKIIGLI